MVSELSRLRWLCRRGMKELDVIMSTYLERHYTAAGSDEKAQFESLLEMQDPELYNLRLGRIDAPDPALEPLLELLRGMSAQDKKGL